MGQILHGSARTTAAVRAAVQRSQESLQTLAARHGINPKMVARLVSKSVYMIAAMVKPVFRLVLAYSFGRRPNGFFQHVTGAGLGLAQLGFKFAEGQFNRVKIGGIRGQGW